MQERAEYMQAHGQIEEAAYFMARRDVMDQLQEFVVLMRKVKEEVAERLESVGCSHKSCMEEGGFCIKADRVDAALLSALASALAQRNLRVHGAPRRDDQDDRKMTKSFG